MSRHRRERSAGQAGKWSSIKKDTTAFAVFVMKRIDGISSNEEIRHSGRVDIRLIGVGFYDASTEMFEALGAWLGQSSLDDVFCANQMDMGASPCDGCVK